VLDLRRLQGLRLGGRGRSIAMGTLIARRLLRRRILRRNPVERLPILVGSRSSAGFDFRTSNLWNPVNH